MNPLRIEGTDETPEILLDKENEVFQISGRSLPEDSVEFYRPLFTWLDSYTKNPNPITEFVFKLDYANTASSKIIQDILTKLEKIQGAKITWCYQKDDEDMQAMGEEFSEIINLTFTFKIN